MKNINCIYYGALFILFSFFAACKKEFLEKKPSTSIIRPITLDNVEGLLNNDIITISTPNLFTISGEEFDFNSYASFQSITRATERNAFIWNKNLYNGEVKIRDWTDPYIAIFYANNALETLKRIEETEFNRKRYKFLKGWALFVRAFCNYNLATAFCQAYDIQTSDSDLGIPIRLTPDIDVFERRSTLKQTYNQILKDLNYAKILLADGTIIPTAKNNRPSLSAAHALLARIYLSMRKYEDAGLAADTCLALYSKLIDYKKLVLPNNYPFTPTNDETLYYSGAIPIYSSTMTLTNSTTNIKSSLLNLYTPGDIRIKAFFKTLNGMQVMNGTYAGNQTIYPFSGLATDEVYLIKSECSARSGDIQTSMDYLNKLLIMRITAELYKPKAATTSKEALDLVLLERRKELVWRGLRWGDLKRLNKEGANITIERVLDGVTYTLPPNDPRYVFPIPDDELALSKIVQNQR